MFNSDISRLQLAQSQLKNLKFAKRVVDFLIKSYYNKLNELIASWDGKLEGHISGSFKRYLVSFDFYLKAVGMLCSKYPLLIPAVEGHEISIEQLRKDLPFAWLLDFLNSANPGAEKISFPEYVLLTINFHKKTNWQFFLSLSARPHSFTKLENGTYVSSSKLQQTKYLARLRKELLRSCEPGFFKSYLCAERFKEYLYLYSRILFQFQASRDVEWEKSEMMKTLKTFNYIAEHFSPEDGELILLSHFYILFRYVYKSYLKLFFTEKTGKTYEKDLEAVKYYLNKRLNKGLFSQKSGDILNKAAPNSLTLREPLDAFTEQPRINSLFGRSENEELINEDKGLDLSNNSVEDIIQPDSTFSNKDYYIYSSLDMLKKSAPAFAKKRYCWDSEFLSLISKQHKNGLIKVELPGKLNIECADIINFQEEYCYDDYCEDHPSDGTEAPSIDYVLSEIYERKNRKPVEEAEESKTPEESQETDAQIMDEIKNASEAENVREEDVGLLDKETKEE